MRRPIARTADAASHYSALNSRKTSFYHEFSRNVEFKAVLSCTKHKTTLSYLRKTESRKKYIKIRPDQI